MAGRIAPSPFTAPNIVTIGTQTWMNKNLQSPTYRNGDIIPEVQNQTTWDSLTTGAWCYYNNDPANGDIYGKLYNWYAVNDPRGLAPNGWHVPSRTEWTTLVSFLGGTSVAGGAMKSTGTTRWNSPNTGATNSSGFTGLPGGYKYWNNVDNFSQITLNGLWWSSTEATLDPTNNANYILLSSTNTSALSTTVIKKFGLSVRLIKD
jgi:uncharacterized protein (TIGR02145 family)